MKKDEHFFSSMCESTFWFLQTVFKRRCLTEISVYHQHTVGVRGHALLWSGLCVRYGKVYYKCTMKTLIFLIRRHNWPNTSYVLIQSHFSSWLLLFDTPYIIFSHFSIILFFFNLVLQVGSLPTQEGPGYATDIGIVTVGSRCSKVSPKGEQDDN